MTMRLAAYLARAGLCSRRKAEQLIASGVVQVDGQIIQQMGTHVTHNACVLVHGKAIRKPYGKKTMLWMVNKPRGVITTHHDPQSRSTVWDFLASHGFDCSQHYLTVGRLDLASEGLLLVTNDGMWAQQASRSSWKRLYRVRVRGAYRHWEALNCGVVVRGMRYGPIHVEEEDPLVHARHNRWIRVTLTEGKNREIRRIMDYFDLQVSRLVRLSFGPYHLHMLRQKRWQKVPVIQQGPWSETQMERDANGARRKSNSKA